MEPSAGRDTQTMPKADGLLWAGEHWDTHPRGGVRAGEHLGWLQSAAPGMPWDATHSTPSHRTLPEVPGMGGLTAEAAPPASPFSSPQLGCSCQCSAVSQWQPAASSFPALPGGCLLLPLELCCGLRLHRQAPKLTYQAGVSQAASSIGRVS